MKSDTQVLDEAIESLEQEGMWCQGTFSMEDEAHNLIGLCAEGAIRWAAGYRWQLFPHEKYDPTISNQCYKLESKVAEKLRDIRADVHDALIAQIKKCRQEALEEDPSLCFAPLTKTDLFSLHTYNDDAGMRVTDIILAMKHAREELADG